MTGKPTYEALEKRIEELEQQHTVIERRLKNTRLSEERLQDLYDNAPDLFVSVDARTAIILDCNQTMLDALGYSKRETIGRHIFDMYTPQSALYAQKHLFPRFAKQGFAQEDHLQLLRKDGSFMDVSLNVTAVKDAQGNILYSRSIWRDISRRKRIENKLNKQTLVLKGRMKELHCHYSISSLVETPNISLDQMLQGIVKIITQSLQHSNIACSRIVLEGVEFKTRNFEQTQWILKADVCCKSINYGFLEVCYLEERPEEDEGPFLDEERTLIDAMAKRTGRIVQRMRLEVERERLHTELEAALEKVLSGYLPICSSCKKIRDTQGQWQHIESYIRARSEVIFSHGICNDCGKNLYGDIWDTIK